MTGFASGMEARMGEDPSQAGLQLCGQPGPRQGDAQPGLEKRRKVAKLKIMCNDLNNTSAGPNTAR
jgi:hypothetical protein